MNTIQLTNNNFFIISCSNDLSLRIWSFRDKKQIAVLVTRSKDFSSYALVISRNNKTLIYSTKGKLIIWDLGKKRQKFVLSDNVYEEL